MNNIEEKSLRTWQETRCVINSLVSVPSWLSALGALGVRDLISDAWNCSGRCGQHTTSGLTPWRRSQLGGHQGLAAALGALGVRGHSSVITSYRLGELRNHQLVTDTWTVTTNTGATCSHRKSHTKNSHKCFLTEISQVHMSGTTVRPKEISGIKGALGAP